jgi:potassium/chloride transporter 9
MTDEHGSQARRRMPPRSHSTFATRTARDDAEQLNRRGSVHRILSPNEETPLLAERLNPQNAPNHHEHTETALEQHRGTSSLREWFSRTTRTFRSKSHTTTSTRPEGKRAPSTDVVKPRPGAFPRPVGGTAKLGTFAGVFVPTTLNVLSILMFLRFGFILGQTGVVGMMGELAPSADR